jgi:hypothetical protein
MYGENSGGAGQLQDGALTERRAKRLRVAIFIEHDIIYRHFIQSRAFKKLGREADVTFVFAAPGPENKRLNTELKPKEIDGGIELLQVEPDRVFLWRRLFQVSQLVWRPGAEWKQLRTLTRFFIGRNATLLYSMLALPGIYQILQYWTYGRINRQPSRMEALVRRLDLDVLVHPTVFEGYFINDFILVGRRLGIPTIAIMNSWDNPSSKRSVIGVPDWVLVWGPQTRAHAVKYMGVAPERAVSFGAAQFDVFGRPARITREQFCAEYGIDAHKRILLYAGSSKGADEFEHLRMIEDAIDRGDLSDVAIVYRPHPWGHGGHKGERLISYSWRHVVIDKSMRAYLQSVATGNKSVNLADYADTHDLLSCVDALVSPLSTIILEGALHGKPVLCLLAEQKGQSSFDLQKGLVHFKDMYDCPSILMAHGEAELLLKIGELIGHVGDAAFASSLRDACHHFISGFDRPFSERVVDFVWQTTTTKVTR